LETAETDEIKLLLSTTAAKLKGATTDNDASVFRSTGIQMKVTGEMEHLQTELERLRLENKKLHFENQELFEKNKVLEEKSHETSTPRKVNISTESKEVNIGYKGDDQTAENWWKASFSKKSPKLNEFLSILFTSFPDPALSREDKKIAEGGVRDYFEKTTKESEVTFKDLVHFLVLYGPINGIQQRVANVYKLPFFHGFISYEDAASLLNSKIGTYLIRYSQSLSDKGCFVLNVNRGRTAGSKNQTDMIENYVVLWHSRTEHYSFYNKTYTSLDSFVQDPMYARILMEAVDNNSKYKFRV